MNVKGNILLWIKRLAKTLAWIVGSVIFILIALVFLIRTSPVQNFIIKKVTGYVSENTHSRVEIGFIKIAYPKIIN